MIPGFKDLEKTPDGIEEIINIHVKEYDHIKSKDTERSIKASHKKKVKSMLRSYFAQKFHKWTPRHNTFKVSERAYNKTSSYIAEPYEHFCKMVEEDTYMPYEDSNLDIMLKTQFDDLKMDLAAKPKLTKSKLFKCFKSAIMLQLVNKEGMSRAEAIERSNALVDYLLKPSQAIKFTENIEIIDGYTADLICFK